MPDIPGNSSTTTVLAVGGSVVDQLEVAGDRDWIRITLTAGETYQFTLDGSGASPLEDPILRLRDASGNLVAMNDDGPNGVNSLLTLTATSSGTYYLEVGGYGDSYAGGYTLGATSVVPLPVYTNEQIAAYLTTGFFADTNATPHAFAVSTITYNITGLTAEAQALAVAAMQSWSAVTGLSFVATTGTARLTFDDNASGAFTNYSTSGGATVSATVNIGTDWLASYGTGINSYSYQTYLHEIGHALGLGHAGNYDGSAVWSATPGGDNHYINDSWQATVMSYFSQDQNTYVNASYAFVIGPMMADILAIQNLYGVPSTVNAGDTTYGFHSTATGYYDFSLFAENNMVAFTIYDGGGIDTLDASGFSGAQTIDLRAGDYSDIGGEVGNIGIATNAVIENAIGGSGADVIFGNAGANVLNGGGGVNRMTGFAGDDTYVINNAGDLVFEASGAGADTVNSRVSYVLAAGQSVETLKFTSVSGTGNLNLTGNEFAQTLTGNAGNNILDGGGGADRMTGYGGNDTYLVDNSGDLVFEAANGGNDTVTASLSYALAAGQSVEILRLAAADGTAAFNLTGNELTQSLYGNAGANQLDGGGGGDSLYGLGGDDVYVINNAGDLVFETAGQGSDTVNARVSYVLAAGQSVETLKFTSAGGTGNLNLTGNEFDQTITGNAGNNILDGGGGADRMTGYGGNDTYVVDNAGDLVFEAANGGNDTVTANLSYTLAAGQLVETLSLATAAGTDAFDLTGNALAQTLLGNAGANTLNGNGGGDTMRGYGGDDTYIINASSDLVFEAANGGNDTVNSRVSYVLAAGQSVETLRFTSLSGTGNLNLTGNEVAQTLLGNAGANILDGKGGADILRGYGGADTFQFSTTLAANNIDRIVDFSAVDDTIQLSKTIFALLGLGALSADAFKDIGVSGAAVDSTDRILYDHNTGALYYDADGSGVTPRIQFAVLDNKPTNLTHADFLVVA